MGGALEAGSRPGRGIESCLHKELELGLVPELEPERHHASSPEADSWAQGLLDWYIFLSRSWP